MRQARRMLVGMAVLAVLTALPGARRAAAGTVGYGDSAVAAGIAVGNVLSFGNPCVADLDGDGFEDLVIDRHNKEPWDVYRGRADGTFAPMASPPARRVDTHDCASGDFDGDGDIDLYGTVGACEGTCARTDDLWINDPAGWTLRNDLLGPLTYDRAREATVADLNNDGWLDVAVVAAGGGVDSNHEIYWNRGRLDGVWQGFTPQAIGKALGAVDCVEAADVTGDGLLDLLICQRTDLLVAAAPSFVPTSLGRGAAVDVVVAPDGRWLVTRNASFEIWNPDRTVAASWPLVAGADSGLVDLDGDGTDEIVVVQGIAGRLPDDPGAHFVLDDTGGAWQRVSIPQPSTGAGSHVARVGHRALILNGGIDRTIPQWDRRGPRQLIGDPALVPSLGPRARATLAAGGEHSCALSADGSVRCWGRNAAGQLGDGATTDSAVPVVVGGLSGVVAVAAGGEHSCALLADGSVRCWGRNAAGQLGDGATTDSAVPVVAGGVAAGELSAGHASTCAVTLGAEVRCWGDNADGQIGTGDLTTPVPVAVVASGLSGMDGVGVGRAHACAVHGDGRLSCWGRNSSLQLGSTATGPVATPVAVTGPTSAVAAVAGAAHTCVLLGDGTVSCFGSDEFGQSGRGSGGTSEVPAPVGALPAVPMPSRVPASPRLPAGVAQPGAVNLTWGAPGDTGGLAVVDYAVQVSADAGVSWTEVTHAPSVTPALSITGLADGTPYVFRVAAITGVGRGMWSATSAAVTPVGLPAAPTGVAAVAGSTTATVSWVAPAGSAPVTDYVVQYLRGTATTWVTVADGVSTATTATATGLLGGTSYRFRVAALNAAGTGAWSTPSDAVTTLARPAAPTRVVAVAGSAMATVSWVAPAGSVPVTDYVVQYARGATATWVTVPDGVSTATTATVNGLVNGTAYRFRVAAVNGAGTGVWSAVSASVTPSGVPGAPTGLVAVAGPAMATLSWVAPAGPVPVTDYVVQYAVGTSATWVTVNDGVSTATTATVSGLRTGTGYRFRVAAKSGTFRGNYSTTTPLVTVL